MTHRLKTVQPYFDELLSGRKTFEIRKNDHNFKVGDELLLLEWDRDFGHSGNAISVEVRYITDFSEGLREGYVVMAVAPWKVQAVNAEVKP